MYPKYENTPEGRARAALEHPDGEEYPGANDWAKEELIKHGDDPRDVERKYGPMRGRRYP